MSLLLVCLFGGLGWRLWPQIRAMAPIYVEREPPLPGQNTLTNLRVERDPKGRWIASFDYFYTGSPEYARGVVAATSRDLSTRGTKVVLTGKLIELKRGAQHVSTELTRPPVPYEAVTTPLVVAELRSSAGVAVREQIEQSIQWPDQHSWTLLNAAASSPPSEVLTRAIGLIDKGRADALDEARLLLEYLVSQDPKFEGAYIELARVAMKTAEWPDGLRQAQALLDAALQIRPDSVNAKVLLAYVHTHLGRHAAAEALFGEAAAAGTNNLWLWANWGELLVMKGQPGPAIEKYREALRRPPTGDTYDRARLDAYTRLLVLLQQRRDLDAMEALYKQRSEEYAGDNCYGAEYGRFLLFERGDTVNAVALARRAVEPHCAETLARQVLGLAHYVDWSKARDDADRVALLNQARIYMPMGPQVLYRLAAGERTVDAARQLLAAGEAVDQLDNRRFNALAYALTDRDHAAARRLLRLGAKPDCKVDQAQMPVAMLPVLTADLEGLRLLQRAGVDYANLRLDGMSALEIARRMGDQRVIQALSPRANTL